MMLLHGTRTQALPDKKIGELAASKADVLSRTDADVMTKHCVGITVVACFSRPIENTHFAEENEWRKLCQRSHSSGKVASGQASATTGVFQSQFS